MIRANLSDDGLNIGRSDVNMTYLYGLGDFFSVMFEDTSSINLLLEANSEVASEIYSRFLQLTSTLSLEDIQATTGSAIRLMLIDSSSAVPGRLNEFYLPANVVSARYAANRPMLPTELLEADVDYLITTDEDGRQRIRFAADIDNYSFSSRVIPGSTGKQYAIWLVDAHLDEQLLSDHYAKLIGISPESSSEQFANFVYGLYSVYVKGPTLTNLRKGLNLTLGIPLARMPEEVLDIRKYLETDQYLVITDQNQYLIPYGLAPSVSIGDRLSVGDELAQWIEIKDYTHDGDWWANLYIPKSVIPTLPSGQDSRYAVPGSQLDAIMRDYLKKHTFYINVNVANFKNVQHFAQLGDIIRKVKPSYTQPLYVWTVKQDSEEDDAFQVEDEFKMAMAADWEEDIGGAFRHMRRNATQTLRRGVSRFIRFNAPQLAVNPTGEDPYTNSGNVYVEGTVSSGFSNGISQFRPNTLEETAWVSTINNRCSDTWRGLRDQVGFRRGLNAVGGDLGPTPVNFVETVPLYSVFKQLPEGVKIIPLTVISQDELELKCGLYDIPVPGRFDSFFFAGGVVVDFEDRGYAVNSHAVNQGRDMSTAAEPLFPGFFRRDSTLPVNPALNKYVMAEFMPNADDITASDMIAGFRISCDIVGLYLITFNNSMASPAFNPVDDEIDHMAADITAAPLRGMGPHRSPWYLTRGNLGYNSSITAINSDQINWSSPVEEPAITYQDTYNVTMPANRGGMILNHRVDL